MAIRLFDTRFVNRLDEESLLPDSRYRFASPIAPICCYACRKDFVNGDLVHTLKQSSGYSTKTKARHLKCAIYHQLLTIEKAKELAPKDLSINWQDVRQSIKDLDAEKRRSILVMARAYTGIAAMSLMLATWSLIVFLNA